MGIKEQLQSLTDKVAETGMEPEEAKKMQADYTELMTKAVRGASDMLVDLLCKYSDHREAGVCINITPHYIRVCQMKYMFGKWTATHLDSVCLDEWFTADDMLSNIDEYVTKLKEIIKKNNIKTKNVSLSLPLSSSIVQVINVPQMEDEELAQAATMESFWQGHIHTTENLYEYSISYRVIKRRVEDNTMDLLFVASKLDDINLYAEIVKRAELNPVIVDVRCFALKNAMEMNANSVTEAYPSAFLELGPDENHVLIFDDNEIYTYEVSLTNVSVPEAMIENFKNADVLELFVNEYANQVREIIQNHQTNNGSDSVKHIYVVSFLPITNTFIQKLSGLLQEYFISEYNILDHVDVPLKLSSRVQGSENMSAWAVTMGTAVRKLDIFGFIKKDHKVNSNNLLPGNEVFIKEERFKLVSQMSSVAVSTVIFVIALSLYLWVFGIGGGLAGRLEELAEVESTHLSKTTELAKLSGMNKRLRSLDEIKATLPSNQKPVLIAYKRLNEVIPEGVWLKELVFSEPKKIQISGSAIGDQQILDFISMLNEGDEFNKMALSTMKTVTDKDLFSKREVQIKNFTLYGEVNNKVVEQRKKAEEEKKNKEEQTQTKAS